MTRRRDVDAAGADACCVAAGTTPEHHLREASTRAPSSSTRSGSSSSRTRRRADGGRRCHARRRTPTGFFTSYNDGTAGSSRYYGDNHPRYAGNVVKAMASAQGRLSARRRAVRATSCARSIRRARPRATRDWRALVRAARRRAARAASSDVDPADADDRRGRSCRRRPRRGTSSPGSSTGCRTTSRWRPRRSTAGTPLLMEGIALTGAWVDKEKGLLSLIALEMGVSSRLVRVSASPASRSS